MKVVGVLAGCAFAAALLGAAPAQAAPISSHAMVYSCCLPTAEKERIIAEAAAAGARYVRVDVELHGIFLNRDDEPDWRGLDETIRIARRHDVELLGIIRGAPHWLTSCPQRASESSLCPPRDMDEFGRLAGEVAHHARDSIRHWEILNEPDASWAFKGGPEDYARMLSTAHDAIAERAPQARVVFGGVERPRELAWLRRVLDTPGADAIRKFDIAAVHLRVRLRNELPELARWLRGWRALLADRGFRGPVWVTEHGYPADTRYQWDPAYRGGDAAQAAYLSESLPLIAEAGADQVFVTLRDNDWGEFLSEGIAHIDRTAPEYRVTRRPAFETVRRLTRDWDQVMAVRAARRASQRQSAALAQLARRSSAAGRELAAALQEGAALGHELAARTLAQRLDRLS